MSIPEVASIFALTLIVIALIGVLLRGRGHQRRLGPINATLAPGQPPAQNVNPAVQNVVWFTYGPWMWRAAAVLVVTVIALFIFLYWTSIVAFGARFERHDFALLVLVVALALWLILYLLDIAGKPTKGVAWLILAAVLLLSWDYWTLLLPAELRLRLMLLKNAILQNLVLALVIIGIPLLFFSNVRKLGFGLIGVAMLMFFLMPNASGITRSDRLYAWMTTPSVRTASGPSVREEVWARNTSRDCPGKLLGPFRLDTAEVQFNPKGCYFYALGSGTVKFTGLYMGDLTVDLRTGAGDSPARSKVYAARAAYAPVEWQYILCSGPKKDMSTMDCR